MIVGVDLPTTVGLIDWPSIRSRFGSETLAIGIGAAPSHPLGGAGAARTTAVGTVVKPVAPSAFRAVTRTRSVLSTSTFFSTYVFSVAPPMLAQLPPSLSQRRQSYVNEVGVPVHVPLLAVRVWPSSAVPEIVGGDWFAGGACDAAPPVSAKPATAASRSRAPTAASPSVFMLRRMFFPSSDGCFRPVLSGRGTELTRVEWFSQDAYTCG